MDITKTIKDLEKQGFTEVGAQTNETWNFVKGVPFRGVFVEVRQGVGQNNSNIYVFEGEDQKRYGVWGSTVLDIRLSNLSVGEEVAIIYLGLETSEKTDREYKNYKVLKLDTPAQETITTDTVTVDEDGVPFPDDDE